MTTKDASTRRARAGANARAFGWDRERVARERDVRRMEVDPAMRPNVAPAGAAEDGDCLLYTSPSPRD